MDDDKLFQEFSEILKSAGVIGCSQIYASELCCEVAIKHGVMFHRDAMKDARKKPRRRKAA